ncbi:MAG: SHOCT domain-containing protein [Lachnospirales bacterium]
MSKLSDEELQNKYDFYIAEKILNKMLETGLISDD